MKNKISIIIPVYNTPETYLKECFDSLKKQTYKNIEVLIVNDGSNEVTTKFINNYNKEFKVINKKNEGVSVARNTGIEKSTGDLILFLDSDDWLETNTCEIINKKFAKESMDVLVFNGIINYSNKKVYNQFYFDKKGLLSTEDIKQLMLQIINKKFSAYIPKENVVGVAWGKVYNANYLKNNKFKFNKELKRAEDHCFFLEILKKSPRCKYINEYLYNYRQSETSTVNKYTNNIKETFKKTLIEINKIIDGLDEVYFDAYNARCITYIINSIKSDYCHKNNKNKLKLKLQGIKELLNDDIYIYAINNVKQNKLSKKQQFFFYFIKKRKIILIYIINKIYIAIKDRRIKKCQCI